MLLYGSPVLAMALTVLTGMAVFAAVDSPPLETIYAYFVLPVQDVFGLTELCVKAAPLILIALGLSLAFRANVWNIGAEGQLICGAIASGGLAILFYRSQSSFLLPAMFFASVLGGMFWAAIVAFLKIRFQANEILTSLMLTYIAVFLLGWLVHGPWRDPDGYNFPQTRPFSDAGMLSLLVEGSRLHAGVLFALVASLVVWVVLSRSVVGLELQVVGRAPRAARFAGFSERKILWVTLLTSGGMAGLAGFGEVAGVLGQLQPTISPGYGFAAIIVAFLGRLHPVGIVFAGLLLALTYLGGDRVQMEFGLPSALTGLFQGVLLFYLLACDGVVVYCLRWSKGLRWSERAQPNRAGSS